MLCAKINLALNGSRGPAGKTTSYAAPHRPYARNARKHSKKQVRAIADAIETFGINNPVLIDETGMTLCGHGRVDAAKLLGWTEMPCVVLEHLSDAQKARLHPGRQ